MQTMQNITRATQNPADKNVEHAYNQKTRKYRCETNKKTRIATITINDIVGNEGPLNNTIAKEKPQPATPAEPEKYKKVLGNGISKKNKCNSQMRDP